MKIKRVFHRWEKCEEYKTNMWKAVPPEDREGYVNKSRELMLDCVAFENAMRLAVDSWPFSCEAALSASKMNHQAWIGHAGCAINHNAPEDLTRQAWRTLTKQQQDEANAAADRVIEHWRTGYIRRMSNA